MNKNEKILRNILLEISIDCIGGLKRDFKDKYEIKINQEHLQSLAPLLNQKEINQHLKNCAYKLIVDFLDIDEDGMLNLLKEWMNESTTDKVYWDSLDILKSTKGKKESLIMLYSLQQENRRNRNHVEPL